MAQIVIIGAGLTGLATAYELERHGLHDYAIFEAEETCGGLCRSVRQDGFTFDYTGHFLHCTNPQALQFLDQTLSFDKLDRITRNSAIYSQKTFTSYPYQSNLHGLPVQTIADCIKGFVQKKSPKNLPRDSFAFWVIKNFGHGFANHFFYPYQEKLLCHSVRTITNTWVGNFVPDTSLKKIIEGIIQPSHESVGYNAHFYYPRAGGIDHLIDSISEKITQRPLINHKVIRIDLQKHLLYCSNGHQEPFEYLVSTAPLKELLITFKKPNYAHAADHLHCNFLLNINFGIERTHLTPYHWIYYPEKIYPFFRIGIPHMLTSSMAPDNHSSIAIEIASPQKPRSLKKIIDRARTMVKTVFGIHNEEIVHECILQLQHAYVLYDRWRDQHLKKILGELSHQNIYSIGRYGAWKYSSMQEAILEGIQTADTIFAAIQSKSQIKEHAACGHLNPRSITKEIQ